jgi:hypothetical protein
MSHINQPSVSNCTRRLLKTPYRSRPLTLPTSALTSDYRYHALPESLNNLSVRHHMILDHMRASVRVSSSL